MQRLSERLLPICALLVSAALSIYWLGLNDIRYMADDFCMVSSFRRAGIAGSVAENLHWQGRFSYYFVQDISAALGSWTVTAWVVLALIAWYGLTFAAIRFMFPKLSVAVAALGTALLIICIHSAAPNPIQSFYWQAGMLMYTFAPLLFTLLVCLIFEPRLPGWIGVGLCATLAFFTIGVNELFAVGQGLVLLVACVVLRDQPRRLYRLGAALLATVLSFGVVTLLTLGADRATGADKADLGASFQGALYSIGTPLALLISRAALPVLALLLLSGAAGFHYSRISRTLLIRLLSLIALGLLVFWLGIFLPTWYFTSNILVGRAYTYPLYFTLIGLVAATYAVGAALPRRLSPNVVRIAPWVMAVLCIATVASIVQQSNSVAADLHSYAAAWDARDTSIRAQNAEPGNALKVGWIGNRFLMYDLNDDPQKWPNTCIASYYGVPGLFVDLPQ